MTKRQLAACTDGGHWNSVMRVWPKTDYRQRSLRICTSKLRPSHFESMPQCTRIIYIYYEIVHEAHKKENKVINLTITQDCK